MWDSFGFLGKRVVLVYVYICIKIVREIKIRLCKKRELEKKYKK